MFVMGAARRARSLVAIEPALRRDALGDTVVGSEQTSLAERQRVVDDAEAGALEAWARHRRLADVVGEAVRRADAAARLDVAIRLHDARARAAR